MKWIVTRVSKYMGQKSMGTSKATFAHQDQTPSLPHILSHHISPFPHFSWFCFVNKLKSTLLFSLSSIGEWRTVIMMLGEKTNTCLFLLPKFGMGWMPWASVGQWIVCVHCRCHHTSEKLVLRWWWACWKCVTATAAHSSVLALLHPLFWFWLQILPRT